MDVFEEDVNYIVSYQGIPWVRLKNKSVFITGATGLIGKMLVKSMIKASESFGLNINIVCLIRNERKFIEIFNKELKSSSSLKYIVGNFDTIKEIRPYFEFIIHLANPTSSKYFVSNPVETIQSTFSGVNNTLELAKKSNSESYVFLSSMEVYGLPTKGTKVSEEMIGCFKTDEERNSYPLSKLISENLVLSYNKEYNLSTKVIRLTQSFGPGVDYNDTRLFAYLAKCAIENKNIILNTDGNTERSYIYIADTITAILSVLLKGNPGQIYNAANESTYCSIKNMSEMISKKYNLTLKILPQDIKSFGYANELFMDLDSSKLRQLGWNPNYELEEMFDRMIDFLECSEQDV